MPFDNRLLSPELRPIAEKATAGQRISDAEALAFYETRDWTGVGMIANAVRERLIGETATYINNRYINYSNVCLLSCEFCAFGAKKRDAHAFELSLPEILDSAREGIARGATEIHMVGGLHPSLPGDWYLEMLRGLRGLSPDLVIKAFTAVELRHLAQRVFKMPLAETLALLRENGLGSITGGGAEIFDQKIRDTICKDKETADEWCEVHRIWHTMGGLSTCTMLYGHIESASQRVDHLRRLRNLQDETGGFTGFVPFAFEPEGARPTLRGIPHATACTELRNLAVARIYLDNIPHITAYWVSMGLPLAQIALSFGVDDLHGTIAEEKIFHMAGARTPQSLAVEALEEAICAAGRRPVRRDTFYRPVADSSAPGAGQQ